MTTELGDLLDRVRRMDRWRPDREPRRAWICGHGDAAVLAGIAAAGLGAEHVVLHADPSDPGPDSRLLSRLPAWRPEVRWDLRRSRHSVAGLVVLLRTLGIDLFVDTSGSGFEAGRAAARAGLPAYLAAACTDRIALRLAAEAREALPPAREASIEACLVLAGAVSHDHAFRHVMRWPNLPPAQLDLDLRNPWNGDDEAGPLLPPARPLRLLLVGAGGLGHPALLSMADRLPPGSLVAVVDDDRVEVSNRVRQFLFTPADAAHATPKAEAVCREASALRPEVDWVPIVRRFPHDDVVALRPFDAVLAFTDSFASRLDIDRAEIAPVFVHAAVDTRSASAAIFHPQTARAGDALGLRQLAAVEQGVRSCAAAQPSIIATNLVAAGLAMARFWRHCASPQPARVFSYELGNAAHGGAWPPFAAGGGR